MKRPALTCRLFVFVLCMLTFALATVPNVVLAAAGKVKEFPIPTANSAPAFITIGLDGNLWFTEQNANQIGRITRRGVVTEFGIPTANSLPTGITIGPDGNLWFTELSTGVRKYDPSLTAVKEGGKLEGKREPKGRRKQA